MNNTRNTIQKQVILNAVRELKNHPTSEEVYNHIKPNFPSISYDKGDTEENIEILTTIEKACEVIRRRKENTPLESIPLIEENGYYLTYPSIMGNICSAKNSERVESALVYMYYKNKLIEGYGANFPNPAVVSKNVPGKFMFCFMPKKIDSNESINIDLDL